MTKNEILRRWVVVLAIMVAVALLAAVLLILYCPDLAATVALAIPPGLFVALSWMIGAWYGLDKGRQLAMILTVGMAPLRLLFCGVWIVLASFIPGVRIEVLLVAVMVIWALFTVPEFGMLISFSHREHANSQNATNSGLATKRGRATRNKKGQ